MEQASKRRLQIAGRQHACDDAELVRVVHYRSRGQTRVATAAPQGDMPQANLQGLRVLAFETRHSAEIEELVRGFGGEAVVVPAVRKMRIESQEPALVFAANLLRGEYDLVIFLTDSGVRLLMQAANTRYDPAEFLGALRKIKIASRGPKPSKALAEYGIQAAVAAPEPHTWRELIGALEQEFGGSLSKMRVAVQEYAASNLEFLVALAERSGSVTRIPLYEWALPEDVKPLRECVLGIAGKYVDIVLFTTAVQVIHLFQVAKEMANAGPMLLGLKSSLILSIGPSTSEELRRHGLEPDFEPSHPTIQSLLREAIEQLPLLLERKHTGSRSDAAGTNFALPSTSTRAPLHNTADAGSIRIGLPSDPASTSCTKSAAGWQPPIRFTRSWTVLSNLSPRSSLATPVSFMSSSRTSWCCAHREIRTPT